MQNPEAFYDALLVLSELAPSLNGVSRLEVQRTAYLACLLALLRGRPLSEWGYRFARTEFGTPFAAGINDALEFLLSSGMVSYQGGRFYLGPHSGRLEHFLGGLASFSGRNEFLEAACGSVLAVPPAVFSEGLDNEPTVQSALHRAQGGGLLEGPAMQLLYEHFRGLAATIDVQRSDLLTPSMIWLSYVANQPISRLQSEGISDD
jgi:hypothetical protein